MIVLLRQKAISADKKGIAYFVKKMI